MANFSTDKPAAATSNGGGGVVGPAGVTTASRRKRSSAASQLLPVNGTALLTHPASDIKLERLSPESDTASPQSSPSPARVFPPGLGFVLGLRPGLVPGHPFPPGVIAAAAAQAAVDRQTLAAPALKQVEMMTRNYSDFMRSLAAKYNNPTGQDGFGFSPSNGAAPPGLLRGFEPPFPFKAAGTPPLPTSGRQSAGRDGGSTVNATNHNAVSLASSGNVAGGGNVDSDAAGLATPHHGLPPHHGGSVTSAAQPRITPPLKPSSATSSPPSSLLEPHRGNAPFNLSDFSSSQTLLNLVRTASAQSASQLETYLRGAVKRPHDGEPARADPLDLSVGTAVKRPRSTDSPRSSKDADAGGATPPPRKHATSPWLLQLEGARGASKSPKLRCGSVCSDQASSLHSLHSPCSGAVGTTTDGGQQQLVAKWTVDDVVHFVASVESCQEYAEKFREQSIDGTSLPLLTEDHLTVYMGMRLGPALKLRTSLAKMTGRCTVCMHCIHCHGEENDRRSNFSASPAPAAGSVPPQPQAPGTPVAASTPPAAPPSATPPAASSAAASPASSK